ncbi:hypothetical protein SD70_19275 [Gordoniibacillus kamchatkensis]|uniref:Uncharacterized protein n=1 Tax=Gordoniibacillus kamchatkensis TaxID=1590651 RepID=A0ABR5AF74_9BACL|nr:hypothetical protein [Paenibacillus sp. VKM B-2647]KIL39547.1 hypothetical protein SD70_19275 [Paenibacillus sp. VKM B-2647]
MAQEEKQKNELSENAGAVTGADHGTPVQGENNPQLPISSNAEQGEHRSNFEESSYDKCEEGESDDKILTSIEEIEKSFEWKAEFTAGSIVFGKRWKVTVYWAKTIRYPKGAYLVEFKYLKFVQSSQSYVLHELYEGNEKKIPEILSALCEFGGYLSRKQLEEMISYAKKLALTDYVRQITSAEFESLLGGALDQDAAYKNLGKLEEELFIDLSEIARLSEGNYSEEAHKAIVLDTPDYPRGLVAVHPHTVDAVFTWNEDSDQPSRVGYNAKTDPERNEILYTWKKFGLLKIFTKSNDDRNNDKIKGIPQAYKHKRFYILEIPKVYEAVVGGVNND